MTESHRQTRRRRGRRGVGLVVVSHSRVLARAAVALAAEMLHGRPLRIEVAAGLDDTTFGTDAVSIMEAIERADGPAGVVVLMDLGSAVLSAELALDLLQDPSVRDRVTLSPAPSSRASSSPPLPPPAGPAGQRSRPRRETRSWARPRTCRHRRKVAHTGAGRRQRRRGRRRLHGREPPRPARPAGRPPGQRGPRARRVGPAAQPHHGRRSGPGRKPEPGRDAGRAARTRGRGPRLRATGAGSGRAPAHPRRRDGSTRPSSEAAEPRLRAARASISGPLPASPGIAIGPVRRLTAVPVDLDSSRSGSRPRNGGASWSRSPPCAARSSTSGSSPPARWARRRRASSTRTSRCWPTPRCSPTSRPASAPASGRSPPGLAAWPTSSASGPACPTPTCRERAADVHAVGDQVLRALTGEPARQMTAGESWWPAT